MTKVNSLKKLAVSLGCTDSIENIPGDTIVEVIDFIDKNKPFGDNSKVLFEWDGNTDGLTKIVAADWNYYRVGDSIPLEDIIGSTIYFSNGEKLTINSIEDFYMEHPDGTWSIIGNTIESVATDDFDPLFPKAGFYHADYLEEPYNNAYITKIVKEEIKTIDKKYLPKFTKELLLDITVENPTNGVNYTHTLNDDELNKIKLLLENDDEFLIQIVYNAYSTDYIATLRSYDAVLTSNCELLGISKTDGLFDGTNKININIKEKLMNIKSAQSTLKSCKIYRIIK